MLTGKKQCENDIDMNTMKSHFEELFKGSENTHDEDLNVEVESEDDISDLENVIFNSEITDEEILNSIKKLKESKSAGPDDIPPGIFIHSQSIILPLLTKLFNRLFDRGEFPDSWSRAKIVPLHKKGDKNLASNYRGISLLNIFGKLYTSVLNRRLTFFLNVFDKITECQAGFRHGYSTIDNAFILQAVIDKCLSKKRGKIFVAFVDFKTAYDSIQRNKLWDVLKKNNIKGKLYKAFNQMYNKVKACVRLKGNYSDFFDCPVGLKQGCMASPLLFSFFINDLAVLINNSGIKGIQLHPHTVELLVLLFADDVAMMSDTVVGLQRQLNVLQNYCIDSGLTVNTDKTKVVVFKKGGKLSRYEQWTYNGHKLHVENRFSYVGITFSQKLSLNVMASEQATKAKRVLISILSSLYKYGQLPNDIYFKLFDMKIKPILMYGAEIWGIFPNEMTEIVQRYACKRFLCVNQKSTNAAVMAECE